MIKLKRLRKKSMANILKMMCKNYWKTLFKSGLKTCSQIYKKISNVKNSIFSTTFSFNSTKFYTPIPYLKDINFFHFFTKPIITTTIYNK